jgi:hypothetical protein
MTDNKGEEIRFVAGNYIGETGWLNAAKRHTKLKYYVIVDLDDEEKATLVWKTSVKLSSEEVAPTSFEEACLRQHPDIDAAFDQIAILPTVLCTHSLTPFFRWYSLTPFFRWYCDDTSVLRYYDTYAYVSVLRYQSTTLPHPCQLAIPREAPGILHRAGYEH